MAYHINGFHTWRFFIALQRGSSHKSRILRHAQKSRIYERLRNNEMIHEAYVQVEPDDSNPFVTLNRKLVEDGYLVLLESEVGWMPIGYQLIAFIRESQDWGIMTVWKKP